MAKPGLPPFDQLDPAAEWAPWKPTADQPWDAKWAAHLYRRAAFGPTRDDLKQAVADGMDATVDRLLAAPKEPRRRPPAVSGPPPDEPDDRHAGRLRAGRRPPGRRGSSG